MDNVYIHCKKRIIDSIIARYSRIESAENTLPPGLNLVIGENTFCRL